MLPPAESPTGDHLKGVYEEEDGVGKRKSR